MRIQNYFNIGDFVYLKTDEDQKKRIVTGINVRIDNISYQVTYVGYESTHYEFEILKDKDLLIGL